MIKKKIIKSFVKRKKNIFLRKLRFRLQILSCYFFVCSIFQIIYFFLFSSWSKLELDFFHLKNWVLKNAPHQVYLYFFLFFPSPNWTLLDSSSSTFFGSFNFFSFCFVTLLLRRLLLLRRFSLASPFCLFIFVYVKRQTKSHQ